MLLLGIDRRHPEPEGGRRSTPTRLPGARPGQRAARRCAIPFPGAAEQSPRGLAARAASGDRRRRWPRQAARPAEIAAVGITGQLDGCLAVDRDGSPARRRPDLDGSARHRRARPGRSRSWSVPAPAWSPTPRTRRRRSAGSWTEAACRRDARFHQPVSFLVEQLTGAVRPGSRAGLDQHALRPRAARLGPGSCASGSAIDPHRLPSAGRGDRRCGRDHRGRCGAERAARRARRSRSAPATTSPTPSAPASPGRARSSAASARPRWWGRCTTAPSSTRAPSSRRTAFPGGRYFVENPGWLSGGAMRWLRDLLGVGRLAGAGRPGRGGAAGGRRGHRPADAHRRHGARVAGRGARCHLRPHPGARAGAPGPRPPGGDGLRHGRRDRSPGRTRRRDRAHPARRRRRALGGLGADPGRGRRPAGRGRRRRARRGARCRRLRRGGGRCGRLARGCRGPAGAGAAHDPARSGRGGGLPPGAGACAGPVRGPAPDHGRALGGAA